MNTFSIKDIENISGIKAHTIRIWEQRYSFLKPKRSDTNIRHYCNDELKIILNIALLNKHGFKISRIDKMKPEEICSKILELKTGEAFHDRVINDLIKEMIDLKISEFEKTLGTYIDEYGLENAVKEIIFPLLERIGILWQTGHIMPAQEHFVSSIIRQKLIVAIDKVPTPKEGKLYLLFLPEGEHHELGLLFLHFLLKSHGKRVVYLGANVPMKDIESIVDALKPFMAFIHLTGSGPIAGLDRLLRFLAEKTPSLPAVISGLPTQSYCKNIPTSVRLVRQFSEMLDFVSTV